MFREDHITDLTVQRVKMGMERFQNGLQTTPGVEYAHGWIGVMNSGNQSVGHAQEQESGIFLARSCIGEIDLWQTSSIIGVPNEHGTTIKQGKHAILFDGGFFEISKWTEHTISLQETLDTGSNVPNADDGCITGHDMSGNDEMLAISWK